MTERSGPVFFVLFGSAARSCALASRASKGAAGSPSQPRTQHVMLLVRLRTCQVARGRASLSKRRGGALDVTGKGQTVFTTAACRSVMDGGGYMRLTWRLIHGQWRLNCEHRTGTNVAEWQATRCARQTRCRESQLANRFTHVHTRTHTINRIECRRGGCRRGSAPLSSPEAHAR